MVEAVFTDSSSDIYNTLKVKEEKKDESERNNTSLEDNIAHIITLSKTPNILPRYYTSITKLDLYQANLTSLPKSLHESLPNLSILFCMKNNFKIVPEVIGKCQNLQMVSFKSNNIKIIEPNALQKQMRWLILTDNHIQYLPSTVGRCSKLQKLMLSGNSLIELPSEISKCTNLELIRLASNKLVKPPFDLLRLPNLSWIALSDNPFLNNNIYVNSAIHQLIVNVDPRLDDPDKALSELGRGASGITRRYNLTPSQGNNNNNNEEEEVAVKEYYSNITSDGNPQEERLISMVASSLGCESLVNVIGQTNKGNLIMELLTNYKVFANPPSLESCSRDIYDDNDSLSTSKALNMMHQLLHTLMKLHEKGINHGDFYGHNILVSTNDDDNNRIWLTDFGAAFFYDATSEFGNLLQRVERRAFGHLVREIADLIVVKNKEDLKVQSKLYEFSCVCVDVSFAELYQNFVACEDFSAVGQM